MPGKKKPSNATWIAKAAVNPASAKLEYPLEGSDGDARPVVVYWYPGGKVKNVLQSAGPCVISRAFLPGKG